MAVGYGLYGLAGFDGPVGFPLSVALAFGAGMGVSFTLNRRFTYPASGRRARSELRDFFFVSLGGLALTAGLAQTLYLGAPGVTGRVAAALGGPILPETVAHAAAVAITAVYSFFAHRHVSFRRAGAAPVIAPAR